MSRPARDYPIDLTGPDKAIVRGHLRLGGTDPRGNRLDVTNAYVTWNDRPLALVSGEFHYSRCPVAYWEDELLKVKAGGVNTVATYVFWGFHEEQPGQFEWTGQKDVRRFVELCARHDLNVILRIGPFAHGEWRNGGLPDWLYGQPYEVRSNDARYLARVELLYREIGAQVRGLLFADGGPIIGIQLENEYMHAGAPWEVVDPVRSPEFVTAGTEGAAHLIALKALAERAGLVAPLILVTAWGAPIIEDETLPVYGGYAYPVWIDNPGPSDLYLFRDGHARPTDDVTHRVPDVYPLIYAEMQGGIQVRYNNRPIVPARAVEAMALVCIGNGSNWLGYYMYHGGTTPRGAQGFSHERLHPQLSYDFQAPIGEYGERRESYHGLRLLHLFLGSFGERLGPMRTHLPGGSEVVRPEDVDTLRYCVRSSGQGGFLFVNNFQDHVARRDFPDVAFVLNTCEGTVRIPEAGSLTIRADSSFILPINLPMGAARLIYATAQPITVLADEPVPHYFFVVPDGLEAELCFEAVGIKSVEGDTARRESEDRLILRPRLGPDATLTLTTHSGQRLRVTTLSRDDAVQLWRGRAWGADRVILSSADLTFADDGVVATTCGKATASLRVWPAVEGSLRIAGAVCSVTQTDGSSRIDLWAARIDVPVQVEQVGATKVLVRLPAAWPAGANDVFLTVDYDGDYGMAHLNGRLIADHIHNGTPWRLGLKQFAAELRDEPLCLVLSPLREGQVVNTSSALAGRIEFVGHERLLVRAITATPEYAIRLTT